jgi:hypothetical protein
VSDAIASTLTRSRPLVLPVKVIVVRHPTGRGKYSLGNASDTRRFVPPPMNARLAISLIRRFSYGREPWLWESAAMNARYGARAWRVGSAMSPARVAGGL